MRLQIMKMTGLPEDLYKNRGRRDRGPRVAPIETERTVFVIIPSLIEVFTMFDKDRN